MCTQVNISKTCRKLNKSFKVSPINCRSRLHPVCSRILELDCLLKKVSINGKVCSELLVTLLGDIMTSASTLNYIVIDKQYPKRYDDYYAKYGFRWDDDWNSYIKTILYRWYSKNPEISNIPIVKPNLRHWEYIRQYLMLPTHRVIVTNDSSSSLAVIESSLNSDCSYVIITTIDTVISESLSSKANRVITVKDKIYEKQVAITMKKSQW